MAMQDKRHTAGGGYTLPHFHVHEGRMQCYYVGSHGGGDPSVLDANYPPN